MVASGGVPGNGWKEWQRYVLKELKRQSESQERIRLELGVVREEIATLKVKSGVWGAAAGLATAGVALAIAVVSKIL